MKIVIIGCGKVGRSIVKHLVSEKHDITIIDNNKQALDSVMNANDVQGIYGNGAVKAIQQEAGVNKADIFIAVTDKDELNMVCCRTAESLGAKTSIARIRDTDYVDEYEFLRESLGIDLIVNPEQAAAEELCNILRFPFATQVYNFNKGKVSSVEIKLPAESKLCGMAIRDIATELDTTVHFAGVLRGEETFIPNGDFVLQAEDRVVLVGKPSKIDAFFKGTQIFNKRVKSVLIIGGSRISFYLTRLLAEDGIKVKIIEKDKERCKNLIESLDKVEVINADGALKHVLDEENLSSYDACIGLTGLDEQNIIISLYAKTKQVETTIAKVNYDMFTEILDEIGLNATVSPKEVIANQIVLYSRSLKAKNEGELVTLYKILDGEAELLEFNIKDNENLVDKTIKDIKLKQNIYITSIVRKNQVVSPSGEEVLQENDTVIVSTTDKGLKKVNDILR